MTNSPNDPTNEPKALVARLQLLTGEARTEALCELGTGELALMACFLLGYHRPEWEAIAEGPIYGEGAASIDRRWAE